MDNGLTIKEIAELFQIPASTLRFWERKGLITPDRNNSSGYREYSPQLIEELCDIITYRSLNLSIKELKALLNIKLTDLEDVFFDSEVKIDNQIKDLLKVRKEIKQKRLIFEQFKKLKNSKYTLSNPGISKIVPFSGYDNASMQLYMTGHYDYFLVADASNPCSARDGLSVEADFPSGETLWENVDPKEKFIECLVTTESNEPEKSDLPRHLSSIKRLGHCPSLILAKYLFNGIGDDNSNRQDYYHTWIKIES